MRAPLFSNPGSATGIHVVGIIYRFIGGIILKLENRELSQSSLFPYFQILKTLKNKDLENIYRS